jgi:hypothetical protein
LTTDVLTEGEKSQTLGLIIPLSNKTKVGFESQGGRPPFIGGKMKVLNSF